MDETVYRGIRFRRPDVLRAFGDFDRDLRATFPEHRYKDYAISYADKWYPPKEILRLATQCEVRNFVRGGGPNVNRCFEQLGFAVVAIRGANTSTDQNPASNTLSAEDFSALEGRRLLRLHKARERSQVLIARKKRQVLSETGRLSCEACDFDFSQTYGQLGEGFAECHHRQPLSEAEIGCRTRLSDLAVVCANCHRMLHRRPWRTVESLREIVRTIRARK